MELTAANYFEPRDDCSLECHIGAGLPGVGVRHFATCGAVVDTGHAYRENVARAAEDALFPAGEIVARRTATKDRPRYRIRKIGSKHDYIRRYAVVDTGRYGTTGQPHRVDGVRGGLTKDEAQAHADALNEQDERHSVHRAWVLTAGAYADTEVVGFYEGTRAQADALASRLTAVRARSESGVPRDLIEVTAEPTSRFNADGSVAR